MKPPRADDRIHEAGDAPCVLLDPGAAPEVADADALRQAGHVAVVVVRAERDHDHVRLVLLHHLADAVEPVVDVRPLEPGRDVAVDRVDRLVDLAPHRAEQRVAGDDHERVAADVDAQRVRRRERRLLRRRRRGGAGVGWRRGSGRGRRRRLRRDGRRRRREHDRRDDVVVARAAERRLQRRVAGRSRPV